MRYTVLTLLLLVVFAVAGHSEYVERIDGGSIIGDVTVESDKITIQDWDGKSYTFYRDYIRRIRSQETGKFETYKSKSFFELWTDIAPDKANAMLLDLEMLVNYINKTFGFKKPPTEQVTVRVFASTRDYENLWDNRFGDTSKTKKTLAFYDLNFKDVSSVYAGRDTFTVIAPRFATLYLMRLYPGYFETNPLWLHRGWYKMFENCRADSGEIDMVGLSFDEMESLQEEMQKKPFSFEYFFSFKITQTTKKSEYELMEQKIGRAHV